MRVTRRGYIVLGIVMMALFIAVSYIESVGTAPQ